MRDAIATICKFTGTQRKLNYFPKIFARGISSAVATGISGEHIELGHLSYLYF